MMQSNAYAGIYKCQNADGKVSYNDELCPSGQEEKKVSISNKTLTPSDTIEEEGDTVWHEIKGSDSLKFTH